MRNRQAGFTLVEVIVVIISLVAAGALLTAYLSPRETRHDPRQRCANNLRQLATAAIMYTADYNGRLPGAWYAEAPGACSGPGGWIGFQQPAPASSGALNPTTFAPEKGTLWEYVGNQHVYRCGDDEYAPYSKNSYAISGWAGRQAKDASGNVVRSGSATYCVGSRLTRFRNPGGTMLFIEEGPVANNGLLTGAAGSALDTTDDGYFFVAQYGANATRKNAPTSRHNKGFNVVYVDGHADYLKLGPQVLQELWADPYR